MFETDLKEPRKRHFFFFFLHCSNPDKLSADVPLVALPGGGSRGRVVYDAVRRHSEVAGPAESEGSVEIDRVS